MARPGTQKLAMAATAALLAAMPLAAPSPAAAAPAIAPASATVFATPAPTLTWSAAMPRAPAILATTGTTMAWKPELTITAASVTAAVSQPQVVARAAEAYAARLATLDAAHALDADTRFLERVQRIAAGLIAQAASDYPETAGWSWQIHTTAEPEQDADCMAGGKILVGQPYAERLALNDAELAMLLSHEIAHAALRHNLQEYELALRLEPNRAARPFADLWNAVDHDRPLMDKLAPLGREQEAEADRAGLLLAVHAGWPPERLANYYHKLLRASDWPARDSDSHPSPLSRWHAMQALASTLQH